MSGGAAEFVRVWFAPPEAADSLDLSALADTERDEWTRLKTERRRRDWKSSRALERAAAAPPGAATTLSHCRGHAAFATAPAPCALGVDLEQLAPRSFVELAESAFAPEEAAWVRSLAAAEDRCAAFYELWTLKEACTKALRLHLVDGLRQCRFVDRLGCWRAELPVARPWRAAVYAPRPELRLAWIWIAGADGQPLPGASCHEWPGHRAEWPLIRGLGHRASPAGPAC